MLDSTSLNWVSILASPQLVWLLAMMLAGTLTFHAKTQHIYILNVYTLI